MPVERHAKRIGALEFAATDHGLSRATRNVLPLAGETIDIELFRGERLRVEGTEVRGDRLGTRTWMGRIDHAQADRAGSVALTSTRGGELYGTVEFMERHYTVLQGRNGKLYAAEIDQGRLPPDDAGDAPEPSATKGVDWRVAGNGGKAPTGSANIDVLVLYTPAVAAHYSPDGLIGNAMANLNAALGNAALSVRMNLVDAQKLEFFSERPGMVYEDNILDPMVAGAGVFSGVPALRDQLGADLVVLLVRQSTINSSTTCGVAASPKANDSVTARPTKAFAVVGDDCATATHTFSHEVAHLLSARHQRGSIDVGGEGDNATTDIYKYAHGHINTVGTYFRTIMAVGTGCSVGSCPRINYFSNPRQTYDSRPLGESERLPNGLDNPASADNAMAIGTFAPQVAGYRDATVISEPPPAPPANVSWLGCYGWNRAEWQALPTADYYEVYTKIFGAAYYTRRYSGVDNTFDFSVTQAANVATRACNGYGCSNLVLGNAQAAYWTTCN